MTKKLSLRARQRAQCATFRFQGAQGQIRTETVPIYVISCRHRQDRRDLFEKEWKQQLGIPFQWFLVDCDRDDPKRGCWTSHQTLWKNARAKGQKWICILEDDATLEVPEDANAPKFPRTAWDPMRWNPIPADAVMAYLGGTAHWLQTDVVKESFMWNHGKPVWPVGATAEWTRAVCWTTHAYLVNVGGACAEGFMKEEYCVGREVDRYFKETIHPYNPVYLLTPACVYQRSDYSDIEGSIMNYAQMAWSVWGCPKPVMKANESGELVVSMPNHVLKKPIEEIPTVSIITPTYGRAKFFPWVFWNIAQQVYPMQKVEWLIIEEDDPEDTMYNTWHNDELIERMWKKFRGQSGVEEETRDAMPTIRWVRVPRQTVGSKRNQGVQEAKHDIIVHFDDDDYYPAWSVLSRVNALESYRDDGIQMVGASVMPGYYIPTKTSFWMTDGRYAFGEASMGYYREWALQQGFDETIPRGEYVGLMQNRWSQCMDISSTTHVFPLQWGNRKDVDEMKRVPAPDADFQAWWDENTMEMIQKTSKLIA